MKKSTYSFTPDPITWQTQATWDRMTMADLAENGLIRFQRGNPNTTMKLKTAKGNKQNVVRRAWDRRDKLMQDILDEAAVLHPMQLPLVLHFNYIEPKPTQLTMDIWHVFSPHINAFAWWTCPTPHGTFVTIKHNSKKSQYESFFVRVIIEDEKVTLLKTLSAFHQNRAGSLARLCGRKWVYNMGKWYSLYDLFKSFIRNKRESSLWFWFEDEMGVRSDYPRRHHTESLMHVDKTNHNAYWFWEVDQPFDPLIVVPEPAHQSAESIATGDISIQPLWDSTYQLDDKDKKL